MRQKSKMGQATAQTLGANGLSKRGDFNRMRRREAVTAYLMISPLLVGLAVFFVYTFIVNIYYSLTNKGTFGKPRFIGFENYVKLFNDPKFFAALTHTFLYVLICVPLVVVFSIFLAVLLNKKLPAQGLYRTLIFIPAITMPAAIGLVWKWLLNYEYGLINSVMRGLGLKPVAWLSDPKWVLLTVSLVLIWTDVSQRMIIILAGLQGIPSVYYEAADIDGATPRQKFFGITLPLLSPSIFFITLMEMIGVFQIFDFIYLMIPMSSSGMGSARSMVSYFYECAFLRDKRGYAAAITVVLFLIILVITIIQMRAQRRWVYQEG